MHDHAYQLRVRVLPARLLRSRIGSRIARTSEQKKAPIRQDGTQRTVRLTETNTTVNVGPAADSQFEIESMVLSQTITPPQRF